jgi:AcrR family transcriptional regulator
MAREEKVERWLRDKGLTFEYVPSLDLKLIDRRLSEQNQARPEQPILTERAEAYAIAMLDGAEFPALVVYRAINGGYVVITGNHRIAAAHMAERLTFDAYVVQTTDELTIELLTRTANVLEGDRGSPEEHLHHAIYFVEMRGMTVKDAANECGVSATTLQSRLRRRDTDRRLGKIPGVDPSAIAPNTRVRLGAISNDAVLGDAAQAVVRYRLGGENLATLVREVNEARTEAAQRDRVRAFCERDEIKARLTRSSGGKRRVVMTDLERLVVDLRRVQRQLLTHPIAVSGSSPSLDTARTLWGELRGVLDSLLGAPAARKAG